MIQEYRKASAEALGVDWKEDQMSGLPIHLRSPKWHPDTDANQMLMVKRWLAKQGVSTLSQYGRDGIVYFQILQDDPYGLWSGQDRDELLATMKAFMEWQRKEEGG